MPAESVAGKIADASLRFGFQTAFNRNKVWDNHIMFEVVTFMGFYMSTVIGLVLIKGFHFCVVGH